MKVCSAEALREELRMVRESLGSEAKADEEKRRALMESQLQTVRDQARLEIGMYVGWGGGAWEGQEGHWFDVRFCGVGCFAALKRVSVFALVLGVDLFTATD